jgi:hypothetical protein
VAHEGKGRTSRQPLESRLAAANLTADAKARLSEITRDLDDLGRLDEASNKVYVDEQSLRRLLKKTFSPEFEQEAMAQLKRMPDSKLVDESGAGHRRLTPLPWDALVDRVKALSPRPDATYDALGLTPSSTLDDINKAVKQRLPDAPDNLLEPERLRRHLRAIVKNPDALGVATVEQTGVDAATVEQAGVLPDIWGCFVKNLGFWGAVALGALIAAIIGALLIALGPAGIVWAMFWTALAGIGILYLDFLVIWIVFSCLGFLAGPPVF